MRIDAWSDIACPWCWLGKHHLEEALRREGVHAQVEMRSFELDPTRGATAPAREHLARKLGGHARVDAIHERLAQMGERAGIRYDFGRQQVANTFDAHRVHHLAKARGRGPQVIERFLRAYHGEGADLADHATIRRLAAEEGLDAGEVDSVLASGAYGADVRADELEARELGIHGVPFFLIDGRYALSGAQPVEAFVQALRMIRGQAHEA
jgi:predicted DsbA family dithiol-disulfide isomerase